MFNKLAHARMAVGTLLMVVSCARATGYPEQSVRIVVPHAPAGASNILARVSAQQLYESQAPQTVIDTKSETGSTLCGGIVAKVAPDAYAVLLFGVSAPIIGPTMCPKLLCTRADLAPVINVATLAHMLIAAPASPLTSLSHLP